MKEIILVCAAMVKSSTPKPYAGMVMLSVNPDSHEIH